MSQGLCNTLKLATGSGPAQVWKMEDQSFCKTYMTSCLCNIAKFEVTSFVGFNVVLELELEKGYCCLPGKFCVIELKLMKKK